MTPEVAALLGALIGFVGAIVAAAIGALALTWQARVARERDARQRLLRLVSRAQDALHAESRDKDDRESAELNQIADELDAVTLDFRKKEDRRDLRTCVHALQERFHTYTGPLSEGLSATATIYGIVKARADSEKRPDWIADRLANFSDMLKEVEEERAEYERDLWEREKKEIAARRAKRSG